MKITLDLGPKVGESTCGKCRFVYVHKEVELLKKSKETRRCKVFEDIRLATSKVGPRNIVHRCAWCLEAEVLE